MLVQDTNPQSLTTTLSKLILVCHNTTNRVGITYTYPKEEITRNSWTDAEGFRQAKAFFGKRTYSSRGREPKP